MSDMKEILEPLSITNIFITRKELLKLTTGHTKENLARKKLKYDSNEQEQGYIFQYIKEKLRT